MILSTVHHKRRTAQRVNQLERQIMEVLQADHPQSVRHVFYRMTNPRLPEPVTKDDSGYRQVQHRITEMRRAGTLPYGWIADATRRGYHTNTFTDSADFIRRFAGLYRANLWEDSDYVEVWCESRSIAGVIQDDCEDLAVSLYPAGGFSSITLVYDAAEAINRATGNGQRDAHVIYVGDYDPAGVLIDQSIEKELRAHLHPGVSLDFERIAITEEQIAFTTYPKSRVRQAINEPTMLRRPWKRKRKPCPPISCVPCYASASSDSCRKER